MQEYSKKIEIRWADLDPNFHVLHSKYYDFGAYCRMSFLTEHGITPAVMIEKNIGPIIFREGNYSVPKFSDKRQSLQNILT